MLKRVAMAMVATLLVSVAASAQTSGSAQGQASSATPQAAQQPVRTSDTGDVRPATTTPMGDTGLWFVPTAEILPAKRWSASAYRRSAAPHRAAQPEHRSLVPATGRR